MMLKFTVGGWCTAVVPGTRRQEDQQSEADLGGSYERVCLKTQKKIKTCYSEIKGAGNI